MPHSLDTLVTVFGGSGFLGRHLIQALARRRFRIRVGVRRPDLAGHLQPLGPVGQIHAVQSNVRFPDSIEAAVRDAAIVINLTGILFERGPQRFEAIHTQGAATVAQAAARTGARMLHVSALGADPSSPSRYARSKALGEAAVLAAVPDAMIFRPSILFGPEDDFFNRFAAMAQISPILPLIGGGTTRFQPAFVGDVASALAQAADGAGDRGTIYEFGGPDVKTFKELMEFLLVTIQRRRILLRLPFGLAAAQAQILQFLPHPPLTPDQVTLLRHDNVVSAQADREARTFLRFGIAPAAIAATVPTYLWRFRKTGQFRGRLA